jgi:hypothetical protein
MSHKTEQYEKGAGPVEVSLRPANEARSDVDTSLDDNGELKRPLKVCVCLCLAIL